jgi:vitamin B12 transporter
LIETIRIAGSAATDGGASKGATSAIQIATAHVRLLDDCLMAPKRHALGTSIRDPLSVFSPPASPPPAVTQPVAAPSHSLRDGKPISTRLLKVLRSSGAPVGACLSLFALLLVSATLTTAPIAHAQELAQGLLADDAPTQLPGIVVETNAPPPPISTPSARDPGPAAQARQRTPRRVRQSAQRTATPRAASTRRRRSAPTAQTTVAPVEAPTPEITSANRGADDLADVSVAATVVGATEIERARSGGATPARLLEGLPGIRLSQAGGAGSTTDVRIRGAESDQTLVLIDGIRVNDPASTGSEFDFSVLTTANVGRIEVLRGPQSGLYGSDAIGGVVNIVPRKGNGPARAFAEVEGGAFNTLSQLAGVSGSSGGFNYAFAASNFRTDGFNRRTGGTEKDGTEKQSITGNVGYDWSATETLSLRLGYYRVRADLDGLSGDEADEVTRQLFDAALKGTFASFNGLALTTVKAYSNTTERDFLDFGSRRSLFEGRRTGIEAQTDVAIRDVDRFSFGGRYEQLTGESTDISERSGRITPRYDVRETHKSVFALYTFNPFDRLSLTAAGRTDDFGTGDWEATYRLSGAYRIPETGTKIRASYGTGAKAPTIQQRNETSETFFCTFFSNVPFTGNPDLEIEKSRGWDIGIDQALFNERVVVSATYFENHIENLIQFACADDFQSATFINLPSAKISGVEVAGEWRVTDWMRLRGSYTYTDAVDEENDARLRRRPEHVGKLTLAVEPTDGLVVSATVLGQSFHFDGTRERNKVDGFARLDMAAEYTMSPSATLFLRAENLTDEDYQEVRNFATAGRSAYAGVRLRF